MFSRNNETLRKKLGQMIIVGFAGKSVPDGIMADLSTQNLGGIVLSTKNGNLKSPAQIQRVIVQMQNAAETPPFIAIDQEGGIIGRLNASNGFILTPTAHELGTKIGSLDATRKQASLMASWLQSCGFNVNLAPVADVEVNPLSPTIGYRGRSFSADPLTVAAHDQVFVDEFHARNIITTLKHFPGHGSAVADSHLTLPDITNTWTTIELTPYRELLKTNSVDMVMVGHLFNASLDSVYPSSLSRATIQGLLRDSLHYNGVTITDDLFDMKAITANFGSWDAAEYVINAGVDILMYASNVLNNVSLCHQLIDTLESKVKGGLIAEKRIDEAFNRILQLKKKYFIKDSAVTFKS
jgi:beta-N-acetylhexosaminidase